MPALSIPRLPVLGWDAMRGDPAPSLPSLLNLPNLVWTASGRAAIAYALRELDIGAGDRVLAPTYHCPTIVAPIVAAGAQVVFYPISENGMPRLDRIAGFDLRGVRAMIAAHFFGLPQPMSAVRTFCDAHGIALIEDCAHAMFGRADGQVIGSWGDYAIASLTKFFPVLEGGCLASARHPLYAVPTRSRSLFDEVQNTMNVLETAVRYRRLPGVNLGLAALFWAKAALWHSERAAAVLASDDAIAPDVVQLGLAEFAPNARAWSKPNRGTCWLTSHVNRARIITLRRRNYQRLAEHLADVAGAYPLVPVLPQEAAPYVFPLVVEAAERHYQRLRASGVPVFRWDWRWPDTPTEADDAGTMWAQKLFQIGCHQDLTLDEIDTIARTIIALLREA